MRVLIQRVSKGSVSIKNKEIAQIANGYVIFLGIYEDDDESALAALVSKMLNLRIMDDEAGKMNKSILDVKGELLVVSQFTLCADTKKGRRPSYIFAMKPEKAELLYDEFVSELKKSKLQVKTGTFGAMMEVEIINDGPVTILLDSKE